MKMYKNRNSVIHQLTKQIELKNKIRLKMKINPKNPKMEYLMGNSPKIMMNIYR